MIRTMAVYKNGEVKFNLSITELQSDRVSWYWADFSQPTTKEVSFLKKYFNFNQVSIQDCLSYIQRPKMEYYDGYKFFTLQSLNKDMKIDEIDVFLSNQYVVSFCLNDNKDMKTIWNKIKGVIDIKGMQPEHILYLISDEIVDGFFPIVQNIEDDIEDIDELSSDSEQNLIDGVQIQLKRLSRLRKTVKPTKDLIYRILNSTHAGISEETKLKLHSVHDHLVKLMDDISDNREMANDVRESYISTNSHRMNRIMKTLTSTSIIFMPLTFIVGVYGMNFQNIPELHTQYGYFVCWGVMLLIVVGLVTWFKKKDWF